MDKAVLKAIEELRNIALLAVKEDLNVNDVALLTGWKPSYVRKLAEDGVLSYTRPLGKSIFFKKADVIAILNRNRVPSVDELISQSQNQVI